MIALDNGDKIRGDATAASVVDYTLHGFVGTTATQLADGQLPAAIGDLYTAAQDGIGVSSIVLVNTDTVARAVNLYVTPSGGTARRLIPKGYSLLAGQSLHTDGKSVSVLGAGAGPIWLWHTLIFTMEGNLTTGAKPLRVYLPGAHTIDKVYLSVNTAPTGAAIIVDVNKNGTTIFTTQGNRPQIAISAFTGESGVPDVTALVLNDYLTFDIDQIGSTIAGANLTVHVRCKYYANT